MTPSEPQPVTTEELDRVRNALITYTDIRTACGAAGIEPHRVPQFVRILTDIIKQNQRKVRRFRR
ncbi:hypothetical protein [Rhodovarius crocodyli]|uniref:hypothetical protein n=1 Tax=Rhodovarius crocodyli TaxID=1979269 RepID=UPI0013E35413|nr:hypothetical protein [Rhodovarius crocodyli]